MKALPGLFELSVLGEPFLVLHALAQYRTGKENDEYLMNKYDKIINLIELQLVHVDLA